MNLNGISNDYNEFDEINRRNEKTMIKKKKERDVKEEAAGNSAVSDTGPWM